MFGKESEEQSLIDISDLLRYISSLETADIGLRTLDALFASGGVTQRLKNSGSHALNIGRRHVERIRTTGFFKTRACAGDNG